MREIAVMALGAAIALTIVHWFKVYLPQLIDSVSDWLDA